MGEREGVNGNVAGKLRQNAADLGGGLVLSGIEALHGIIEGRRRDTPHGLERVGRGDEQGVLHIVGAGSEGDEDTGVVDIVGTGEIVEVGLLVCL